ncbi:MAG: FecR domain-containing protein [Betaproteobacteria bacterium]|nr:FecR domain-containing protein [Betaproteobacteria bacterium]
MTRFSALLASLALVPLVTWADPPGRVARLSLIEGQASVFVDPAQGWEGAQVNSTLTSENSVWTDPRSRAEVRFGATAIALGEVTQFDIVRLDDETFRAHVARGSLAIHIRELDPRESYYVATPEARFQLRGTGRYRVDTDPERGESRLTVLSGNARLESAGGFISVDTGRSVRVTGGERPGYELEPATSSALDDWAIARDQRLEQREAARYVPQQMTGWEELDDYGVWRNEPEYGAVWYPTRVVADWAPYRYGRWTWVRPWGWSWVDDAPWGYAPSHYGRWAYIGNRWGWYPGRYESRPIWAPALVGWVGRPGWSVSISTGPANVVGWYPLSPYDRYQPWYSTNVTYVNNVNRVVIPPRRDRNYPHYDNRDRGATVVPRENFGSHRPVQSVITSVSRDVVAAQPVVPGSSVLPPRYSGRPSMSDRTPPTGGTRPPARGEPGVNSRPASPALPGTPATKPVAAPSYPSMPSSQPSRVARPVPAYPASGAKPPEASSGRTKPPESRGNDARPPRTSDTAAKPSHQPAPSPSTGKPSHQPAPSPSAGKPSAQPAPSPSAGKPSAQPAPSPSAGKPSAQPAPTPSTGKPSAQPAPSLPSAKPGRPVDKPAEQGQGG